MGFSFSESQIQKLRTTFQYMRYPRRRIWESEMQRANRIYCVRRAERSDSELPILGRKNFCCDSNIFFFMVQFLKSKVELADYCDHDEVRYKPPPHNKPHLKTFAIAFFWLVKSQFQD